MPRRIDEVDEVIVVDDRYGTGLHGDASQLFISTAVHIAEIAG